ncbi:MAG: hypothetical protein AB1659_06455 [Thermodesulfobacteriota bacterium]
MPSWKGDLISPGISLGVCFLNCQNMGVCLIIKQKKNSGRSEDIPGWGFRGFTACQC